MEIKQISNQTSRPEWSFRRSLIQSTSWEYVREILIIGIVGIDFEE